MLDAYLDSELDLTRQLDVERHLARLSHLEGRG
jgi:anti-sigma factor RsiW